MHVTYLSDIHLELRKKLPKDITKLFPENFGANILVLAGDIGNPFSDLYKTFLELCVSRFLYVLVVSGNHEYYTSTKRQRTMEETDQQISRICEATGAQHLTVGKAFDVPNDISDKNHDITDNNYDSSDNNYDSGYRFVGCTLWSEVDRSAENIMNDYSNIYLNFGVPGIVRQRRMEGVMGPRDFMRPKNLYVREGTKSLRYTDVLNLHNTHRDYIIQEINKAREENKKVIIVTHHAPSYRMVLSDMSVDISDHDKCYGTNLEHLFNDPVVAWISGHTHDSKNIAVNNIPSVSNCYGYPIQKFTDTKFTFETKLLL